MSIDKFGRHITTYTSLQSQLENSNNFNSDYDSDSSNSEKLVKVASPLLDSHAISKKYLETQLNISKENIEKRLQTIITEFSKYIQETNNSIKNIQQDISVIFKELKIHDLSGSK